MLVCRVLPESALGSASSRSVSPAPSTGKSACESPTPGEYWFCLGQAPLEVDPVAHPKVGEPGSPRYGRSSMTRCTSGSISACQFAPAPADHAMPSAIPSMASRRRVRCSKTSGRFRLSQLRNDPRKNYSIRRPDIALAITSCWISLVPSKIVWLTVSGLLDGGR